MSKPFDADHPEQVAYDQTCSMWLTEATSDRERHAYRDGHHKGWNNAMNGLEEICAALRAAMADKRAFAICVEGRNGAMFTLHNCDDSVIAARMLERFARQQRADA
jgi:hypothetical protein